MSEVFNFNLTSEVIHHFEKVLSAEVVMDESQIINQVKEAISKLSSFKQEKFVVKHIERLEEMVNMLVDKKWNMPKHDKKYVLAAMSYFVEENDIIPDNIPVVGLLDD